MNITYKRTQLFEESDLVELFTSVGWEDESAAYPHRLENAMYHSKAVFSAWDKNKLVGLLSAIDDSMHVYITYFLVHPNYQGNKIGENLLKMFDERYVHFKKELKTEKAKEYYEKFGYTFDSFGMVKNDLPKNEE